MDIITADDKKQLETKLEALKAKRGDITKEIAEARAQGDLSENAGYHAAREKQGLNEADIRRLEAKLASSKVVDESEMPRDMVFLGAVVKLREVNSGREDVYKIVGESSGRFDADEIEVTVNSPMGGALMKARVGETVKVDLPRGTKRFEVVEIK